VAKQELETAIKDPGTQGSRRSDQAAGFDEMIAGLKQLIDAMPLFKLQMEAKGAEPGSTRRLARWSSHRPGARQGPGLTTTSP
jgi:hypothetical protein